MNGEFMEHITRQNLWIIAVLIIAIFGIFVVYNIVFATTSTKLIPKDLPSWYVYPGEGVTEEAMGHLGKEQYSLINKNADNPPGFPEFSPYHAQATYQRRNSTDNYRIIVWYFDNRNSFAGAENRLLENLKSEGNVQAVSLDLSREEKDYRDASSVDASVSFPEFPRLLNATSFENPNQSGYFFAVKKPILWDREDYFLLGYLAGTENLTSQSPYLEDLIARGYYNVTGSYEELKNERY
jgi:hypothetical protein